MPDALVELLGTVPASSSTVINIDADTSTRVVIDVETAHAGDCCVIDADHNLVWAVNPTASSVISLSEIKGNNHINHIRLHFPCPILPSVASVVHQRTRIVLFVLCTNGRLYRITLAQQQEGMLRSIQQAQHQWLHVRTLSPAPSRATSMLAVHGCLAVGTADGTLLCAPQDDVDGDAHEPLSMTELKDTGNTLGRLFSGACCVVGFEHMNSRITPLCPTHP